MKPKLTFNLKICTVLSTLIVTASCSGCSSTSAEPPETDENSVQPIVNATQTEPKTTKSKQAAQPTYDLVEYGPNRFDQNFFVSVFAQRETLVGGESQFWVCLNGYQLAPDNVTNFLKLADSVEAKATNLLPPEPAEGANIRWYANDADGDQICIFYRVQEGKWYFVPKNEELSATGIDVAFKKCLKDIDALKQISPKTPW